MKSTTSPRSVILLIYLLSSIIFTPTSYSRPLAEDSQPLKYKFPKGKTYRYVMSKNSEQVLEVMGAEQKIIADTQTAFEVAGEGTSPSGNPVFTMTISDFELAFESTLMDSTIKNPPEIMGLKLRKEVKAHGDQVSTVILNDRTDELGGLVAQSFSVGSEFLPNLPYDKLAAGRAVKLTDVDTVTTNARSVVSTKEMEFSLEGEEVKMGYQCVRVRYQGLVNAEGSGLFQGVMQLDIQGDGDIEGVLYFAPREGIVVSDEHTATMELTAKITGPQNMTIPITQTEKRTLTISK